MERLENHTSKNYSLPTCNLATTGGYTDRPTDTRVHVACILCRENLFTEPLPRNETEDTFYGAFAYQTIGGYT
jgi:hypothetical protein